MILDSDFALPFAYEAVTIDNTSGGVSLTAGTYQRGGAGGTKANRAFMTLETAQIRFTLDGTAPTSTVGHLLESGQTLTLSNYTQIAKFKAIRTGSTSGSLRVTYSLQG